MTLRLVSLCTGYGGLDLAVEAAMGAEVVAVAETDRWAALVAEKRFAVPNLGDVALIDWAGVGPVDVLTAGYPCQPFSLGGKRKGEDDPRHLWPHVHRAVRQLRPDSVVLENVPGHRSKGFGRVLGDLAEIGYDARWTSVRAADVGAPHRRERVFVVAHPAAAHADGPRPQGPGAERDAATREDQAADDRDGPGAWWGRYLPAIRRWERITDRPAPSPLRNGALSAVFVEWMMGLDEGWVTALVPGRAAAFTILGNGVVPRQAALALALLHPVPPTATEA